jgi:hypothetical protein
VGQAGARGIGADGVSAWKDVMVEQDDEGEVIDGEERGFCEGGVTIIVIIGLE